MGKQHRGEGIMEVSKKFFTFGAIVLFFSATFFPSICASASNVRHLTVEIDSPKGMQRKDMTVSETDVQKIKQLFAQLNSQLDKVSSEKEKLLIFQDAVRQLACLGVLGDLSIEQAQKLVTQWYRPSVSSEKLGSYLINNNAFCLVSGRTNKTFCTHRYTNWIEYSGALFYFIGGSFSYGLYGHPFILLLLLISMALGLGLYNLGDALATRADMNPFAVADVFGMGYTDGNEKDIWYAQGWVKTIGLLGSKTWEGELVGNLPGMKILKSLFVEVFPAVWGFSGIKIWINEDGSEKSYLGSAILVGLNQKVS